MKPLLQLTLANIRSFTRDRAAVFWTLAFPLIFVVLFGSIFSGGGNATRTIGWVDNDQTSRSNELKSAFAGVSNIKLTEASEDVALQDMRDGKNDAVIVVPKGYGTQVDTAASGGGPPASVTVYTDPSQTQTTAAVYQVVGSILGVVNVQVSGHGPAVVPQPQTIQTDNLTFISYLVPSILGMAIMQLGIFSAIPLLADREKLILKRLNATPLRRWQLVGSNVVMPRLDDIHRPWLRDRLVRTDRGRGQRHDERRAVSPDVPVGHLLPDRDDARLPQDGGADHAVDLPR
jgi:ABC-2 type transport system permease protein